MCRCSVQGTDAIEVTGTGQTANPYVADLAVSADVGNSVEVRADGVFVGAEIVAGVNVGAGIIGDGTGGSPLRLGPAKALATRATNQSMPANTTTAVSFTTTEFDSTGTILTAGSRLVAPVSGVYQVQGAARFAMSPADGDVFLALRKSGAGADLLGSTRHKNAADSFGDFVDAYLATSRLVTLTLGQYVELTMLHFNATDAARIVSEAMLSIHYVGP